MIPEVLALPLEEARRLLEEAGLAVEVSETRPPRAGEGEGPLRVIRQRAQGTRVVLTVTHERYAWRARPAPAPGPAASPVRPPEAG